MRVRGGTRPFNAGPLQRADHRVETGTPLYVTALLGLKRRISVTMSKMVDTERARDPSLAHRLDFALDRRPLSPIKRRMEHDGRGDIETQR